MGKSDLGDFAIACPVNPFLIVISLCKGSTDLRITAMIKTRILAIAFGCLLAVGGVAVAQRPARNVSGARHPNLAAAQRLCAQAFQRIQDAQRANEFDLGGHAQKAKELLDQANNELKQAAETANKR
jgi:hypothetical protein